MHPFIHLFGKSLPSYWLLSVIGILVCWLYAWLANRDGRAGQLPRADLLHIFLLTGVGALVGGKILGTAVQIPTVIRHWSLLSAEPSLLWQVLATGLVFYGGLAGALAAVLWYCRVYGISFQTVVGLLTPIIPLFHCFGRIGCFLAGCCWGIPVAWGLVFTHSEAAPNGIPLLPVQLIEASCNLFLFLLLARLSRRMLQQWTVFPLYLFIYGLLRFSLEFLRADHAPPVFLLSFSQWISLALSLATAVWWLSRKRKASHTLPDAPPEDLV